MERTVKPFSSVAFVFMNFGATQEEKKNIVSIQGNKTKMLRFRNHLQNFYDERNVYDFMSK